MFTQSVSLLTDLSTSLVPQISILDPQWWLDKYGSAFLWIALVVVFIECGLLFPILPGDSLLFATGMFIAAGQIDDHLWVAILLLTIAAIGGNVSGYYLGQVLGLKLFQNPNARFLKPSHITKTNAFFEKYGVRALILGRFVPIVRTFITLVAGTARMNKKKFFTATAIGAVIWVFGITLLGYWLGQIEAVHDNLELALILIVLVSVLPMVFEYVRAKREKSDKPEEPAEVV